LVVTVGRAEPLEAAVEEVALASTLTGVGLALTSEAARPKTPAMKAVFFMMLIEDVRVERMLIGRVDYKRYERVSGILLAKVRPGKQKYACLWCEARDESRENERQITKMSIKSGRR